MRTCCTSHAFGRLWRCGLLTLQRVRVPLVCPEFDVFSEHCFPTLSYGEACTSLGEPYIGNCQYDGAGASLSVLYGNLKARTTAVSANLLTFDQTQVWTRTSPLHRTR